MQWFHYSGGYLDSLGLLLVGKCYCKRLLIFILLSSTGEIEAVMKGLCHGASYYLLKPVRIEELKNIWQHVFKRRMFDSKYHSSFDNKVDLEKAHVTNSEDGQCLGSSGVPGCNSKVNRKRKSKNVENEDDKNKDVSTQKKQRVVWSVELHHKFVAAVNQLGVDVAEPKKILDIMNVERLTRGNVASHLQKYRLELRSLSAVASQQANKVPTFGFRDLSYLPLSSAGSRQLDLRKIQEFGKTVQKEGNFPDGCPSNSLANATGNSLLLPADRQQTQSGVFSSDSTVGIPSLSSNPFKIGESSHLPDLDISDALDAISDNPAMTGQNSEDLSLNQDCLTDCFNNSIGESSHLPDLHINTAAENPAMTGQNSEAPSLVQDCLTDYNFELDLIASIFNQC